MSQAKSGAPVSMTGFGGGEARAGTTRVGVEVRTVNHRYLDVTVKGPREYVSLESRILEAVRARMKRGKVDVFVSRAADAGAPGAVQVNAPLARGYRDALRALQAELGLPGEVTIGMIAALRDVVVTGAPDSDPEAEWPAVLEALGVALDRLAAMRADEGKRLADDLAKQTANLRALAAAARERAPKIVEEYRVRLRDRLAKLLGDTALDPARLAQEVALLAERTDVHEELVRLDSHLDQLDALLGGGGELGRKLDFLLQEVGREINTLGSKANDADLARIVVDLKSTAEKIREQIQNLE